MKSPPRNVDVDEVIPPGKRSSAERPEDDVARVIAHVMDNLFRVPGSKLRFGLDPLLGLLPYAGDTIANLVSAIVLSQSARYGVPKIVMARMAANVLLNTVVGAIPVLGDAFSFWFKSNARNYELLRKHSSTSRDSTRGDWAFVIGLLVVVVSAIVGVLTLAALVIAALLRGLGYG